MNKPFLNVLHLLFLLSLTITVLSSCTKYQYVTIDSKLPKNSQDEFVIENDSFQVTYNFNGWNGPLNVSIVNKHSEPLYINWHKSAIVVDGQRVPLWKDESKLDASIRGFEINWNDFASNQYADVDGVVSKSEMISFLPPESGMEITPVTIKNKFIPIDQDVAVEKLSLPYDQGRTPAKKQSFSQENAPLSFRSFLTISTTQDFQEPVYLDDHFWVSGFLETIQRPERFNFMKNNQFYMRKNTGLGKIGFGALAIFLLTGYLMASSGTGG